MIKHRSSIFATICFCGAALLFASCGNENQQSVPDNQSIETRDIDSDSLVDNRVENARGGAGTDTLGTTSGSTTGGTTR